MLICGSHTLVLRERFGPDLRSDLLNALNRVSEVEYGECGKHTKQKPMMS